MKHAKYDLKLNDVNTRLLSLEKKTSKILLLGFEDNKQSYKTKDNVRNPNAYNRR